VAAYGDVLIQRGNTLDYVGIAAVYSGRDAQFIYPDLMIKIRAADFVDVDFLHLALSARLTRDYFKARASGASGTMPKVNQSVLLETPISVPPLAEQKRIGDKVDRLMSLLDDLEAEIHRQEETATRQAGSLAAAVAA
jgi:type I restriction enzyme S subunit